MSGARRRTLTASRYLGVLAALGALLVITSFVALGSGSADISPGELWRALSADGERNSRAVILLDIRLPRVILAALAGLALAAAGTTFQAVLRNPLAEPYILGVSGGAALGAILAAAGATRWLGGGIASRPGKTPWVIPTSSISSKRISSDCSLTERASSRPIVPG